MDDTASNYFMELINSLGTTTGILSLIGLCGLITLIQLWPKAKWYVLSFVLYFCTFPIKSEDATEGTFRELAFPLNIFGNYARQIPLALLACLIIPAIATSTGRQKRTLQPAILLFFALELWISARLALGGETLVRGVLAFCVFCLVMFVLGIGLNRFLQTLEDAEHLVYSIGFAAFLLVAGNIWQLLINRSAIVESRFYGTTNNPNVLGAACGFFLPWVIYLVMNKSTAKWVRLIMMGTMTMLFVFLLWTGSRGSLLIAIVGLGVLFRHKIYRFIPMMILGAGIFWIATTLLPESLSNVEHLTSTLDTRSEPIARMYNLFLSSPIVGVGITTGKAAYGENSYLSSLANYGIIGGILLFSSMACALYLAIKVLRHRLVLGTKSPLADMACSSICMIGVASMFEAGTLGVGHMYSMWFYISLALASQLNEITGSLEMPTIEQADLQLNPLLEELSTGS